MLDDFNLRRCLHLRSRVGAITKLPHVVRFGIHAKLAVFLRYRRDYSGTLRVSVAIWNAWSRVELTRVESVEYTTPIRGVEHLRIKLIVLEKVEAGAFGRSQSEGVMAESLCTCRSNSRSLINLRGRMRKLHFPNTAAPR